MKPAPSSEPSGESSSGAPTAPGADLLALAWSVLESVPDPEIPVVSIRELGILRDVRQGEHGLEVIITPTYSGCPAMEQIRDDVAAALASHAIKATVTLQLSPAWTTDWMTASAREKLRAYGIAPPHAAGGSRAGENVIRFAPKKIANNARFMGANGLFASQNPVNCPQCGSDNTTETSHFGSTACKALYKCLDCLEPFDYFKPY